jgi:GMP synthase-like glutamine amidotransferase
MKAGLLLCDEVPAALQQYGGTYLEMFQKLFPELDFRPFHLLKYEFPKDLHECEVYMTTGSRYSVYDQVDWIDRLQQFVRLLYQSDKPFVGVCFGHQMIGQALGGEVRKSSKGWCIGLHSFKINHSKDWMDPHQAEIRLLMSCQDQITTLPDGAEVLASSEDCPYALIQVGCHTLGIQAHPEHTASFNQALFESRIDRIGEDKVEEARDSVSNEIDRQLFAQWVMNFFENCGMV